MIKCKGCGADMRFDIEKQALVCDFCDSVLEVSNRRNADIKSEEQLMDMVVHTCPQCGAELYTTDETAATFCSYCGSSVLLESRLVAVNSPDYIIPFKITKEEAEKAYKKKLRKSLFAPSAMKKAEIKQMRGIYMPYWEYYFKDTSQVNATFYKNETVKNGYTCRDKYETSFKVFVESDGLEYDASSQLPDDLSQSYAPFDFKEAKIFNPSYMSGFYADLGDVGKNAYSYLAAKTVSETAADVICKNTNLDNGVIGYKELKEKITFANAEPGMAMYPVWFACAKDKSGKYINYAAVNGQTGKVAADMPVDKKKLILWSLIFAIPFFILFYLFLTPNTHSTVILVALLAIIGSVIGFKRVDKLKYEDGGLRATGKVQRKFEAQKNFKPGFTARMVIIIVLSVGVLMIDPAQDYYFYAIALINAVLCGWTFWRIFDIYNKYIERPLSQLNKRGGDGA